MTIRVQTDRRIRILSTDRTQPNIAVVLNDIKQEKYNYKPQRRRAYYPRNKSTLLEYNHNDYAHNRQAILQKKRFYNSKNKERICAYMKNYFQNHKQQVRRQQRQYRSKKKRGW